MSIRRTVFGLGFGLVVAGTAFAVPGRFQGERPEPSPELARQHLGEMAEHAYERLGATDDQIATIDAELDALAPAMFQLHEGGRSLHESIHDALFEGASREDLEVLRLQAIDHLDQASSVILDHLVVIVGTLTPEQRQTAADFRPPHPGPPGMGPHGPHGGPDGQDGPPPRR